MLKFLRRFGKHFIVIGGSLLLIAWLVPSAMQEYVNNPQRQVLMTVDGHKVRAKEFAQWQKEYAALRRLMLEMDVLQSAEHYMLLSKAAEKAGLVGSAAEGRASIPDIAEQRGRFLELQRTYQENPSYNQFPPSLVSQIMDPAKVQAQIAMQEAILTENLQQAAESPLSVKEIEMALARLRGIARLTSQYTRVARVSRPRALLEAGRQLEKVTVDLVVVSADQKMAEVGEPDDAMLQEQLTRFKDFKPGEGEFGVGYLLPARAKVQYLTLDKAKIATKITPDIKELKRVFRDEYTPAKPGETFEEARPALERQYKGKVVDQILGYADQSFRTEVALATRVLVEDAETGLKKLPADWEQQRPDLSRIANRIVAWVENKTKPDESRPGIRIDPPEVTTLAGRFMTADELTALPGIGSSFRLRGSTNERFADYVLSVREVKPKSTLTLQTGIPFDEPTRDNAGNLYYMCVLDTRTESVPGSIEEARDRLVKDWKRLKGYQVLSGAEIENLKQRAIKEGLGALDPKTPPAFGQPAPVSPLKSNLTVSRQGISPPSADVDLPVLRDAIFEVSKQFEPTQDISALDVSARTFAVALPQKLGVIVGVVKAVTPVTYEAYRQSQLRLSMNLQAEETQGLSDSPYTIERLRKTFNVEFPMGEEAEEETSET